MDRLINFRASSAFLSEVRQAADRRGIPVSRLIREAVHREIQPVVARDGGYALLVAPLDVDVRRFESLVRSAADPGCSVARKVELLEEGLALVARGRARRFVRS